jgi:hypothetical protein
LHPHQLLTNAVQLQLVVFFLFFHKMLTRHPDTVFYYQLGGFLQRRFLYGLHCPDVATLPCVNVHPVDGPFADVLRLSKLLVSAYVRAYVRAYVCACVCVCVCVRAYVRACMRAHGWTEWTEGGRGREGKGGPTDRPPIYWYALCASWWWWRSSVVMVVCVVVSGRAYCQPLQRGPAVVAVEHAGGLQEAADQEGDVQRHGQHQDVWCALAESPPLTPH